MPEIQQARPPFVQFEYRAVEDRSASIERGCYVSRDVAFAIITPAGSKDRIEKIAEDWLADMKMQVSQERLPNEWFQHYRTVYAAWKEGREVPETGISVRNWPVASPAQVEMLLNLRIRTVEELATCNEEAISRMGMGGRALKQKAVDWLSAAEKTGKDVENTASLRAEIEQLKLTLQRLEAENAQLKQAVVNAASGHAPQEDEDDDGDIKLTVAPLTGTRKL